MQFLLDTDICIYALKQHANVLRRLLTLDRGDVAVSVISEAELRTSAAKSRARARTTQLLEAFLRPITILDFTHDDALAYAEIRADLERAGQVIGPMDLLIAAQALARGLTLVSNNQREFGRVGGIRVANWTA